ncbi:MAG: biotin/lipoyl-binding protein [Dehalococcoidia bacterium]
MSETIATGEARLPATEFDESWFEQGTNPWRGRGIAAAVAVIVVAAASLAAWNWLFRDDGEAAIAEQIVAATLGTVTDSIETSGTVASQSETSLSFGASGKVESVNVTLGQQVKAGDVLASLDAPDLEDAVRRAEISLISAQLQLNDLLEGADTAALASADEGYQRALATYETTVQDSEDLRDGPTSADIAAAQQKVVDADAALAKAQAARQALDTQAEDAVDAAEVALEKAETALDRADQADDDAADALAVAEAQLEGAEAAYCPDPEVSFCGPSSTPVSAPDQATLRTAVSSAGPKAALASDVLDANTTHQQRLTAKSAAADAVDAAEDALDDAEQAVNDAGEGPTAAEIKSADAAVSAARLGLAQANDDLADVKDGASPEEIRAAELDAASASASLLSAEANRDEAYAGADADDVTNQRNQVELAQMSLEEALRGMEDAQLIAPFDGTVAELNIKAGHDAGGGSAATAETAADIVLNTPDALRIDLAISEEDLASVEVGQTGTATFDQLDGAVYPITIEEIGSSPTTTQGVVTYEAVGSIDLTAQVIVAPRGTGALTGDRASAIATAQASGGLPDDVATAIAGRGGSAPGTGAPSSPPSGTAGGPVVATGEPSARPAPGMSATVAITVEVAADVIVVPAGAVQQEGPQQFVEVVGDDGVRERVAVQTGLSDGTRTAILSGLEEGRQVVVPAAAATANTTGTGAFPGGGFQGGSAGGGGGTFFGGPGD